ncbi:MAG: hypothetical protein AB7G75_02645 [Candidatus Binatia bacterium]
MKPFSSRNTCVIVAALLLLGGSVAYAQAPGGGLGAFGGELRGESRVEGKVLCVDCSIQDIHKAYPDLTDLYLLKHGKDTAVLHVSRMSNPQRWETIVFPPELQVRGKDKVVQKLTAEKNLWKNVQIEGLLRDDRVLDVVKVTVQG